MEQPDLGDLKHDRYGAKHLAFQEELISAARGEREVDLVLEGAEVANVFSGEVYRSDVAVHRGRVVGLDCLSARETMNLAGSVLAPGFIDGHVHLESSMVTPAEYARAVVPRGTTSVVADPHEIANVWGLEGLHYLLRSSAGIPLSVYLMLPSCVPATGMETSGAALEAEDLAGLMGHHQVLGLGEVMNYPGVIFRDQSVLQKIALARDKVVDGHAPGLSGRDLAAYISAGIHSDHECVSLEEAREKLRLGMSIFIRQGSAARNLDQLLPLVQPRNASNFLLCSDDRHPQDILEQGNLDSMLRLAVELGIDPLTALQMATINAAVHFLVHDRGAIAPGYRADIAVLEDLESFQVRGVIKDGRPAARAGELMYPLPSGMPALPRRMNVAGLSLQSLEIGAEEGLARVMGIIPDQILTRSLLMEAKSEDGMVVSDTDRDILKIGVVERHRGTGNVGLGLVSGFGLQEGALATSVAHDSHNIIVVGVSTGDMFAAADAVRSMGGGLVAVKEGRIWAALPLPIAGLISDRPMTEVVEAIDRVKEAARRLGSALEDPFMTLSFLALPVVPELKLTDRGLVDVAAFRPVPLFEMKRS